MRACEPRDRVHGKQHVLPLLRQPLRALHRQRRELHVRLGASDRTSRREPERRAIAASPSPPPDGRRPAGRSESRRSRAAASTRPRSSVEAPALRRRADDAALPLPDRCDQIHHPHRAARRARRRAQGGRSGRPGSAPRTPGARPSSSTGVPLIVSTSPSEGGARSGAGGCSGPATSSPCRSPSRRTWARETKTSSSPRAKPSTLRKPKPSGTRSRKPVTVSLSAATSASAPPSHCSRRPGLALDGLLLFVLLVAPGIEARALGLDLHARLSRSATASRARSGRLAAARRSPRSAARGAACGSAGCRARRPAREAQQGSWLPARRR